MHWKEFIYQHKEEFTELVKSHGCYDETIKKWMKQVTGESVPCVDHWSAYSVLQRLKIMAKNEGDNWTSYQYAARRLLEYAGETWEK